MPYELSKEAVEFLKNDNGLLIDVADAMEIAVTSIPTMLLRKSRRFTETPITSLIANKMGLNPEDVISFYEETETNVNNNSSQKIPPKNKVLK